jgi:hypothetical protein
MFEPELTLIPEPGGTFTLVVRALVPNTCYEAGHLKPGLPPDTLSIPEVLPFTFEIIHHRGIFCLQYVHYVTATISGLKPGGHLAAVVFSMVDGHVGGEASVIFPPVEKLTALVAGTSPGQIIPGSVHAVVFTGFAGPPATLRVTALVATSTPGYKAELEPLKPQGFNPVILLLRLKLTPPSGPVIQIPSTVPGRYEIKPYKGHYRAVTILNGRQIVTVPVIVIFSVFDPKAKHEFSTSGNELGNG